MRGLTRKPVTARTFVERLPPAKASVHNRCVDGVTAGGRAGKDLPTMMPEYFNIEARAFDHPIESSKIGKATIGNFKIEETSTIDPFWIDRH